MSDTSVTEKIESAHSEFWKRVERTLEQASIEMQDKSRSIQARDAFWYAFEYARCNPEAMNIQKAWEQYKENRSGISE